MNSSMFTGLYNYLPESKFQHFHCSKKRLCAHLAPPFSPPPTLSKPLVYFLYTFAFLAHCTQIEPCILMLFCVWLLSENFEFRACGSTRQSLIPFYCWIVFHSMGLPHFIYSPPNGHLSYFHFFTIVHHAVRNICAHLFCVGLCFYFSWVVTYEWTC